jgi:1-acyl-sn-glycerol-3-phosphate acyltransferase
MEPVYTPIAAVLKAGIRVMGWKMIVAGDEHIPRRGPAVLASNHVSYLDPIMLGWVTDRLKRVPRFLAKKELFDHWFTGPIVRGAKQVPVDRYGDRELTFRIGLERLRAGELVAVFPEGTITTSFVPAEARLGAARLAVESGAPLVPVALWGGQRIVTKHRGRNLQRGVPLVIRIGQPIAYEACDTPEQVTKRLWDAVRDLVDHAQRTYPDQPSGADDRWWLPRHLGGTAPTIEESAEQRRREAAARRARRQSEGGR